MKHILLFLFFLSFSVKAQDFSLVDAKIKNYPKLISVDKLAEKISNDFSSNENKVRAAFSWLAQNIRYDLAEYYSPKSKRIHFRYSSEEDKLQKIQAIKDNIIKTTLSNRKAVCEGYAQTFSKICTLLSIENEVISGYVRNSIAEINNIAKAPNHAWNAVKLNNKWIYVDATWAAGYVMNGKWLRDFNDYFFNIPKEKLFLTHYPNSKLWQLRVKRMSIQQFYSQPIFHHPFLKSDITIVSPISGSIRKKKNTPIKIQLKNNTKNDQILIGFNGSNFAKKPTISLDNGITLVQITPSKNNNRLFLIVNGEVFIEYKLF